MALQPAVISVGGLHRIDSSLEHNKLNTKLQSILTAAGKHQQQNKRNTPQKEKRQKQILTKSIFTCPSPRRTNTVHQHATRLLLGMSGESVQQIGRGLNHLVVLPNGHLTTTIFQLFSFEDEDND